jgi:ribosomal protein S13
MVVLWMQYCLPDRHVLKNWTLRAQMHIKDLQEEQIQKLLKMVYRAACIVKNN